MRRRLLLASNSSDSDYDDGGYLDYVTGELAGFLDGVQQIVTFPYALGDHDLFDRRAARKFAEFGVETLPIQHETDQRAAVAGAEAAFVGGGNTLRLLKTLYDLDLVSALRDFVASGRPYVGSSAGSILCGPSIRTTNDMPIVHPPTLDALGVLGFHINPHYIDPLPVDMYHGESREMRLLEFLEENDSVVVALYESSMLRVDDARVTLLGSGGGRLFQRGADPRPLAPGSDLSVYG